MTTRLSLLFASIIASAILSGSTSAAVLPDDRIDVLYHSYDGGGVKIDGPSLLVRKSFAKNFSVSANYYVDMVSSASIDVVTTASPYKEERTQTSLGFDYLRGKYAVSLGVTNSDENDYTANSYHLNISHDMFGDLTTVTLGYSVGNDEVRQADDILFSDDLKRQNYRLGLSQVITKNMVLGVSYEGITDEGFLNNPYRSVRYLDAGAGLGYSLEREIYPRTRTSNALALRSRYYLPYRAAVHAEYRYFTDTWDIEAHTAELGYTHPLSNGLTLDFRYRFYSQTAANFYNDLFPREQAQNFLARDKELSTFESQNIRAGASYEFISNGKGFIDKASVNLYYDRMQFDYENFLDLTVTGVTPGTEPTYSFDAEVLQFFVSIWF